MILKQISLQNFRSYGAATTTIDLGRGVSLFEGDIGSGKSSILYAVEFALFGLGELEARYILRANADLGRVALEFEVNGHDYLVIRSVERKKGARTSALQTRGWIREPGEGLKELSPTELRSRILHILNFREKQNVRSSSRIFRYAVFTPQELMKEVLMQRPEDRLETLRRAFGIEDYSFASVNTESVLSQLEVRARMYDESVRSLPEKERSVAQLKAELEKDRRDLNLVEVRLGELQKFMAEAASRLAVLETETKRIIQLQSLIPVLEAGLGQLRRELESVRLDLESSRKTMFEIENAERKIVSLGPQYDEYQSLKERLKLLDGIYQEQRHLSEDITRLSEASAAKEARARAELSSLEAQILDLQVRIDSYNSAISVAPELESSLASLKTRIQDLSEIQARAEDISSKTGSALTLLSSKSAELDLAKEKMSSLDGLSAQSVCPLCGQVLSPTHLALVAGQFQSEADSLGNEIEHCHAVLAELSKEMHEVSEGKAEHQKLQLELTRIEKQLARASEIDFQRQSAKAQLDELRKKKRSLEGLKLEDVTANEKRSLDSLKQRREDLLKRLENYEASQNRIRELEDLGIVRSYQGAELTAQRKKELVESIEKKMLHLDELSKLETEKALEIREKRSELEEGEPLIYEQSRLKEQLETYRQEYPRIKGEVERLSERSRQQSAHLEEMNKEVAKLREAASKANKLKAVSAWLLSAFLPALSDIERYVLASINDEFKDVFQRIFSKLVDESDLRVGVDDRFTPIVEQSGYELDVNSLSGGERTAVALAYRLSLNYMVKRANEAMQQANLLILDEPTEGFSPEQIYRFRNALEELACDQVIVVSHERDLEPVSDRIYRVEKVNGESVLNAVS